MSEAKRLRSAADALSMLAAVNTGAVTLFYVDEGREESDSSNCLWITSTDGR
jgi:hypothetical protein